MEELGCAGHSALCLMVRLGQLGVFPPLSEKLVYAHPNSTHRSALGFVASTERNPGESQPLVPQILLIC
jgi:hypothetical protein